LGEIITVYFENDTKYNGTIVGQIVEFFVLKHVIHVVVTGLLRS
jgi:hypothetical protein